jgi:hypothetical protein
MRAVRIALATDGADAHVGHLAVVDREEPKGRGLHARFLTCHRQDVWLSLDLHGTVWQDVGQCPVRVAYLEDEDSTEPMMFGGRIIDVNAGDMAILVEFDDSQSEWVSLLEDEWEWTDMEAPDREAVADALSRRVQLPPASKKKSSPKVPATAASSSAGRDYDSDTADMMDDEEESYGGAGGSGGGAACGRDGAGGGSGHEESSGGAAYGRGGAECGAGEAGERSSNGAAWGESDASRGNEHDDGKGQGRGGSRDRTHVPSWRAPKVEGWRTGLRNRDAPAPASSAPAPAPTRATASASAGGGGTYQSSRARPATVLHPPRAELSLRPKFVGQPPHMPFTAVLAALHTAAVADPRAAPLLGIRQMTAAIRTLSRAGGAKRKTDIEDWRAAAAWVRERCEAEIRPLFELLHLNSYERLVRAASIPSDQNNKNNQVAPNACGNCQLGGGG